MNTKFSNTLSFKYSFLILSLLFIISIIRLDFVTLIYHINNDFFFSNNLTSLTLGSSSLHIGVLQLHKSITLKL
jgi:hypothetical protein